MGLAFKLWRIGSVLTETDLKGVIRTDPDTLVKAGEEPEFLNLDFTVKPGGAATLSLRKSSVSKASVFFTKKLGGSGSGIYYLYPNLVLRLTNKQDIGSKLPLLINTLEKSVAVFANEEHQEMVRAVLDFFETDRQHPELSALEEITGGIYWFWVSINGTTLPDLMPEVWENWFKSPVSKLDSSGPGIDSFTGMETDVGFRTEFKVFSYDQYHDSLNHRVRDNFPLSLESAGKIKLAWIYILEKLVFYYKGLEYIILPNLIMDDADALRDILNRLATANAMTKGKPDKLKALKTTEKKIIKEIKKGKDREKERKEVVDAIDAADTGFITEFKEQADQLGEFRNAVTLDFIFTAINRTNLSFEIKGSIEDVMPSRLTEVVEIMRKNKIEDNTTLAGRKPGRTFLQDYFNRDELYFVLSKAQKQNGNRILQERLYLARLLLTDAQISMDNLMARFQFHREFDYTRKKRVTDGVKDWINFPGSYIPHESKIISFFQTLNKLKETVPCPEKKPLSTPGF